MALKLMTLLIFSAIFVIIRRMHRPPVLSQRNHTANDNTYHAIEIKASNASCHCAQTLNGQRILSSEFNNKVLHQCDKTNCCCNFKHYSDRRNGLDRRIKRMVFNKQRLSYGRRSDDIHNKARFKLVQHDPTDKSLTGLT